MTKLEKVFFFSHVVDTIKLNGLRVGCTSGTKVKIFIFCVLGGRMSRVSGEKNYVAIGDFEIPTVEHV